MTNTITAGRRHPVGSRVSGAGKAYISFGGAKYAKTREPAPRTPERGTYRRVQILRALAFAPGRALSPGEIQRRTGIPRRTLTYYLSRMAKEGLIAKNGNGKCPYTVYTITPLGYSYFRRAEWRGLGIRSVAPRGLGDGVRVSGLPVLGYVVYQPMGSKWGELGLRVGWRFFRRALAELGVLLPRRRVKRAMFYVRDGTVHFDVVVPGPVDADIVGLWPMKGRVLALLMLCFSILKYMGVPFSLVRAAWSLAPQLRV